MAPEHHISAGLGLVIVHWHVGQHQTAPRYEGGGVVVVVVVGEVANNKN